MVKQTLTCTTKTPALLEGRTLARKNACKFLEISCTVGFNLDNLLVGIRTQLILKHHATLNSILRQGKCRMFN